MRYFTAGLCKGCPSISWLVIGLYLFALSFCSCDITGCAFDQILPLAYAIWADAQALDGAEMGLGCGIVDGNNDGVQSMIAERWYCCCHAKLQVCRMSYLALLSPLVAWLPLCQPPMACWRSRLIAWFILKLSSKADTKTRLLVARALLIVVQPALWAQGWWHLGCCGLVCLFWLFFLWYYVCGNGQISLVRQWQVELLALGTSTWFSLKHDTVAGLDGLRFGMIGMPVSRPHGRRVIGHWLQCRNAKNGWWNSCSERQGCIVFIFNNLHWKQEKNKNGVGLFLLFLLPSPILIIRLLVGIWEKIMQNPWLWYLTSTCTNGPGRFGMQFFVRTLDFFMKPSSICWWKTCGNWLTVLIDHLNFFYAVVFVYESVYVPLIGLTWWHCPFRWSVPPKYAIIWGKYQIRDIMWARSWYRQ